MLPRQTVGARIHSRREQEVMPVVDQRSSAGGGNSNNFTGSNESNINNTGSNESNISSSSSKSDICHCICEHGKCRTPVPCPASGRFADDECPICVRPMLQVGLLRNCKHVFCTDCLATWRLQQGRLNCPVCMQVSYTALYSEGVFKDESEKSSAFRLHLPCLTGSDPLLLTYLDQLNEPWLRLAEIILSSECHRKFKGVETLDMRSYGQPTRSCRSFAVYDDDRLRGQGRSPRVVLCCKMRNFSLRLGIFAGLELGSLRPDNEYADEIVRCLSGQMGASWEAIPEIMEDVERRRLFVRKFERVTCLLLVVGSKEGGLGGGERSEAWPAPMRERLAHVRRVNFEEFEWNERLQLALPFHLCTCGKRDCSRPELRRIGPSVMLDMKM